MEPYNKLEKRILIMRGKQKAATKEAERLLPRRGLSVKQPMGGVYVPDEGLKNSGLSVAQQQEIIKKRNEARKRTIDTRLKDGLAMTPQNRKIFKSYYKK